MIRTFILNSPEHFATSLLMIVVIWVFLTTVVFVESLIHFGKLIHYENEYSVRMMSGSFGHSRGHSHTIKDAWQTTEYISTAIAVLEILLYIILLLI